MFPDVPSGHREARMSKSVKELECPRCGVKLEIDLAAAPVRLEYDHDEWSKACVHPGVDGLPTCPEVIDLVREIIERRAGNGHLDN